MQSILDIVSESIKLAYRHKLLWVFALLLTAGGNFPNSTNSNSRNSKDTYNQNREHYREKNIDVYERDIVDSGNKITLASVKGFSFDNYASNSVLGTMSKNTGAFNLVPYVSKLKAHSIPYLLAMALIVLTAISTGIAIGLVILSWALGAFLGGLKDASINRPYTLRKLSRYGRINVRRLVKYKLALFLLFLLAIFVSIMIPVIFLALSFKILSVVMTIISGVWILALLFVVLITDKFALRLIVNENYQPLNAFKTGYVFFKNNLFKTFLLGFINLIVSGVVIVVLIVPVALVVIPFVGLGGLIVQLSTNLALMLAVPYGLFGIPLGLSLIIFFMVVKGYLSTYQNFTWTLLFLNIRKEANDKS